MSTVLVTGGSGFIGAHCILQLLEAGHQVRTTVRNLKREADVRAMLKEGGAQPDGRLSFVAADLENDAGWADAVAGCEYVLHVASPFPPGVPKHEDEIIVPAREGALRVLCAARAAGVKRVVLTSSFAAVGYGDKTHTAPFTETDWTDPNSEGLSAYVKSKTLAERAAWDFISKEGGGLELSVVNPVGVFGPVLGADYSTSILLVQRFMDGAMPGCPKLYFGVVDVRDVADLHLRAMADPAARGERFLAVAGDFMSMLEIAKVLRNRMGATARKVPTRQLPNWLVRLAALRDPAVKLILPELGHIKNATNEKARRVLGWTPRSNEDSIVATAESLIRLGLLLTVLLVGAWMCLGRQAPSVVMASTAAPESAAFSQGSPSSHRLAAGMQKKLDHIRDNGALSHPNPAPTVITEEEVNDYFAAGNVKLPLGVKNVTLQGDEGVINAVVKVDFDEIRSGQGSSNPLLAVFSGVHDVQLQADAAGSGGQGKVHVRTVSIDTVEVPRVALEFFVAKFVAPKYPGVGLDSTFQMPNRIDTATVGSHKLTVTQK